MVSKAYPPYAFGSRLLLETLDELAQLHPNRIYATVPRAAVLSQGFQDVSFAAMARMAAATAAWLESELGLSSNFETIAYVGVPDLRSVPIFMASVRCGYKVSKTSIQELNRSKSEVGASFFFLHHGTPWTLTFT